MKKCVAILFSLVLCLSVAVAESVLSKTTSDLTEVKDVVVENLPADSTFSIAIGEKEEAVAVANTEIAKLVEAVQTADVTTYFGEITDTQGNAVSLTEALGVENVNVHELMPIEVNDYEETYGTVTMTFAVSTPYAKDEQIVVLLGLVTVNADGTQTVTWTAHDADVTEEGTIKVDFEPEILKLIQEGTALIAIVSK